MPEIKRAGGPADPLGEKLTLGAAERNGDNSERRGGAVNDADQKLDDASGGLLIVYNGNGVILPILDAATNGKKKGEGKPNTGNSEGSNIHICHLINKRYKNNTGGKEK